MADNVEVKLGASTGDLTSQMQATSSSVADSLSKIGDALGKMAEKSAETHAKVKAQTAGIADLFSQLHENIRVRFGSINSVFEQFSSKLAIFGAAFAGGALFKGAIESMIHLRDEVRGLQIVFGQTAEKATAMAVQLKLAGISADTFEQMAFRVGRMLKTQSEEFDRLKVTIRDTSGAFLPMDQILQNVYRRMLDFKAGTDQDMFAMATAGRNAKDFAVDMEALNAVTQRATDFQRKFGIEMGPARQAEILNYKISLNETKLVFEEMGLQVGLAVLPRLEKMSGWFMDVGPKAIAIILDALKVLITVLEVLGNLAASVAVKATAEFQKMAVSARAMGQILKTDVTEAWTTVPQIVAKANADIEAINETSAQSIVDIWAAATKKISGMWQGTAKPEYWGGEAKRGMAASAVTGSGKEDFTIKPKGGGGAAESIVAEWKQALEIIKDASGAFNEFSKAQEAQFWSDKLAALNTGSATYIKDYIAVYHLMSEAQKAAAREQFTETLANLKLQIDEARNSKDQQMAAAQKLVDYVRSLNKEESTVVQAALREQIKLRQEWEKKEEEILKIHTKMVQDQALYETELMKLALDQSVALGQASADQKFATETDLENRTYALRLNALNDEIAKLKEGTLEYEKALAERSKLFQTHQIELTKIANAAVLEREKYAIEANKLVESSFATLFTDLANHTKTVKQAFLDFFKSLSDGLNKIAANKLAEQLFGAGTSGGGFISGLTSKIFGGGAAGGITKTADTTAETAHTTAVTADTTAVAISTTTTTALNTVAVTLDAALVALVASANSASAALAAVGASSGGGLGGLFGGGGGGAGGFVPFFAVGTPYVPQDTLAYVHRGEAIIPAAYNRGGTSGKAFGLTVHNHFSINGQIDTRTQDQIAHAAASSVQRATLRIG